MEKDVLAVGDSTALEIIFSTGHYRNRIAKRPRIRTNEGPPDKHVQIISHVVSRPDSTYPVVIRPYKLDLSQFGDKTRKEIEFKIQNVSDREIKLKVVAGHSELFTVELPESIDAGETEEGELELADAALEESFQKSFTIETDDQENSRFTVPVKRTIVSRPGRSDLPPKPPGK